MLGDEKIRLELQNILTVHLRFMNFSILFFQQGKL